MIILKQIIAVFTLCSACYLYIVTSFEIDNVNVKLTKNVNYRFTTFVNLDLCGESIKMSFVLYERPVIFTI